MGQMRFFVPHPERLVPAAAEQAYLAGPEGIPWECRVLLAGNALIVDRDTRESGYLYFPWNVAGRGIVMVCSGSLMERQKPYQLPVELARGTINRLRNQWATWQTAGMAEPAGFAPLLHEATLAFGRAATSQHEPAASADQADEAIRLGLEASDLLTTEYARQVLSIRRSQQTPLGTLLACRLQTPPSGAAEIMFQAAFNTAAITPTWQDIEPQLGKFAFDAVDAQFDWCRDRNLRVLCGPIVQLDRHVLPEWLFLDDDFEEVQTSVAVLVDAVVKRYRGRVHLWNAAARMNLEGAFGYTEEQRLRLVVEAVDRVRALDPKTPVIVSFDQPWAEYIARQDQELTPLHFADTLVRGELGLAGIGLEINLGYWPDGSLPRDAMEFSRQLDRWSQLGVPLVIYLSIPSQADIDPLAQHRAQPMAGAAAGGISPQSQKALIEWLLPVLVAKQSVQAVVWNSFQDNRPHEFAHGGLLDAAGQAKPALPLLVDLRRDAIG
jgi:hypothetical protein